MLKKLTVEKKDGSLKCFVDEARDKWLNIFAEKDNVIIGSVAGFSDNSSLYRISYGPFSSCIDSSCFSSVNCLIETKMQDGLKFFTMPSAGVKVYCGVRECGFAIYVDGKFRSNIIDEKNVNFSKNVFVMNRDNILIGVMRHDSFLYEIYNFSGEEFLKDESFFELYDIVINNGLTFWIDE